MSRLITVEPFGKNDLPSDYLFVQRKYFKTSPLIYPESAPKPIDIWYERPLFGKVDTMGRPVYPDSDLLKPIRNNLFAINFVADAYNDFANAADEAVKSLRTCMSSILDVTNPVKAWTDITTEYHQYVTNVIDSVFLDYLLDPSDNKINDVHTFDDFMTQFLSFAVDRPQFLYTKTAYLMSAATSNSCSGLIIEFSTDGYDDDNLKWTKYLSNVFFADYAKLAASYGFYVHKYIPWSIVANLNSKIMKRYIEPYNLTDREEIFATNYYQSEYLSFEAFKSYLYGTYVTAVTARPYIDTIKTSNCMSLSTVNSQYSTKVIRKQRRLEKEFFDIIDNNYVPSYEKFSELYSDAYFIKKYTHIRLFEVEIFRNRDKAIYDKITAKVIREYNRKGAFSATILLSELILKHKKYLTPLKENNNI
tara:strand:- start:881 stop:2137 length:1257 start_codon:yes stop_codon:yes gene_type:complete